MGRRGLADEPQLLARRLGGVPILVGRRRDRTGRLASTQFGADTVILDDGFQHRRVQRDCDIVLIHARMPLGGWAVLPRGPMREPLSALSRAHVIIVTKADEALDTLGALEERLRSLNPHAALLTAVHEPWTLQEAMTGQGLDLKRLEGSRVGLLSSIGDPEGFEATVQRLQATVAWHRAFPDHHRYQAADWTTLCQRGQGIHPAAVVTTEKDWLRLKPVMGNDRLNVPLWVLGVRLNILTGETLLDDRLAGLYAR
jgi:tetraacyldisaccharide 4'-kinase